nr:MAG TPA: hypothetical protein [Bacteriophage sp.]
MSRKGIRFLQCIYRFLKIVRYHFRDVTKMVTGACYRWWRAARKL